MTQEQFDLPPSTSLIKRAARLLLPVITATMTLQPLAYAAPNPSLLTQQPRFIDLSVDSNVAFVMDDSLSMEDVRLPVPAGLNPGEASGGTVTVRGRATGFSSGWTVSGSLTVERNNEWIYRTAALNPLYYNPAITYRPWNDNGRAGAAGGNFPASPFGVTAAITDPSNGFRFGVTPHDMRYVGPNYEYGSGNNFNRRLPAGDGVNAGANPPAVPAYLTATRPAGGGFAGVVDASTTPRNQDLFTSPMVLATGGSAQCTVTPTNPLLTGLPTIARVNQPQPTSTLTTTPRPSFAITTPLRDTQPRTVSDRPLQDRPTTPVTNVTATVSLRSSTALLTSPMGQARVSTAPTTDSNRTPVARTSVAPTSTSDRTPVARASTPLPAPVTRTVVATLATEYRQEQGACGTWSAWSTTAPAPALCSDPNSEGGVRTALIQTRTPTCPSGSSPNPSNASQCLSACPSGTTESGTQCVYSCSSGQTLISGQCYSTCSGTTPNYWGGSNNAATSTQCIANCPTNTTPSGTQCLGGCPTTHPTLISGQCYGTCGGTTPNYWGGSNNLSTSTQCIANCPSGTTASGTQCLGGGCPSTHPTLISGQCYANCTGTYNLYGTGGISTATQCRRSCSGTVNTTTDQCETCPAGSTRGTGALGTSTNLCYGGCTTGTPIPGNQFQCQACASGTLSPGTGPGPGQCQTCPTGYNVLTSGTRAFDGQCYGACPTTTPSWAFWNGSSGPSATNAWQCRQACPGGTGTAQTGNDTVRGQCFSACNANYAPLTTTGTTCYRNCTNQLGAGFEVNPSNNAQCRSICASPNLAVSGTCYTDCLSGTPLGSPATQCVGSCPAGATQSGSTCNLQCPATHPTLSGTTCYADCPATHPTVNPGNVAQCLGACPAGSTQSGNQCQSCASGDTLLASGQCCPSTAVTTGNCPVNRPTGSSCAAGQWVPNLDVPAPAHYFVFAPTTAIPNPTPSQLSDPANYVRVEINRDLPMSYPKASTRTDCAGTTCTWDEEAQNFANWFTYYRTRLSSAIAVTAESLSGLTRSAGLDNLRLAYGSINYFPNGANPYGAAGARLPSTMSIDGQTSNGALVRGVRPFTEVTPPPAPGSNDRRQEVFDWLFSLRAVASTPNREALDSVGRYFSRDDNRGPWIQPNNPASWTSNEEPSEHLSCRRNYTIMITDGEWTRAPWVAAAPQQPLVENPQSPPTTPLNALSTAGPTITGLGGRTYRYDPTAEVQFSTNAGSSGGTLSDIALFYWSRDLRASPNLLSGADTGLVNSIRPIDPTLGSQGNPAFWQHLTPYLIGYGISASLDSDGTRQTIAASAVAPQAIAWPSVRLENRPTEDPDTIVTDRDTTPINCNYDPATNPSGCGRVDDTFRAGMAARGDFLSATDVGRLAQSIAAAFGRISEIEGTATSLTGRSGTIQSGDRLFTASFRTNVWTGRVQSFNAVDYFTSLSSGASVPSVDSRFPAAASRNILTSTAVNTAVAFPTGAANLTNLSTAQRTALNNDPALVQWLRGDQSVEVRNGGLFRNRPVGEIMGSIVNSQPIFSKATDQGYQPARRPAAAATSAPNSYRDFLNLNRSSRPARIYAGSNGGMLHAFDASGNPSTNANYMNEVFAYVPRAVYPQLSTLASPGYVHRYLVDGPVVEGDVYLGGAWRTVLVGTTGAGPKGVFALDITQRSGSTATTMGTGNVMWDVAGTDAATNVEHLGHIIQPGVIGSGRDGNWYYFVGNGYESTNDKARLLAINLADGSIHVVDTDSIGGPDPANTNVDQRPNGLGGVTPVYDANRNVVAIYGGDRLGRMWKFDLSNTNRSGWGSTLLFTAVNGAGERQPITAAPRVITHPLGGRMVVFGTGKLYERNDTGDNTVQSVYGIWEKNTSSPVTVNKSTLRQFSLAGQVVSGERFRQLTGTDALNWATDNGWYFDLVVGASAGGERVVASPSESFGFANVTTFVPSSQGDPCLGGGTSFFYRLDVAGSFTRSPFASQGALASLPSTVPLSTIVGSELPGGTVSGVQMMLRGAAGTTNTSTTLSSLSRVAGQRPDDRTNPCLLMDPNTRDILNRPIKSATPNCPVTPLRVWRDLPRSQVR